MFLYIYMKGFGVLLCSCKQWLQVFVWLWRYCFILLLFRRFCEQFWFCLFCCFCYQLVGKCIFRLLFQEYWVLFRYFLCKIARERLEIVIYIFKFGVNFFQEELVVYIVFISVGENQVQVFLRYYYFYSRLRLFKVFLARWGFRWVVVIFWVIW